MDRPFYKPFLPSITQFIKIRNVLADDGVISNSSGVETWAVDDMESVIEKDLIKYNKQEQ